jgi:hypothetical protein
MTPEEVGAELGRLFSGPHPPPGKTVGTIASTTSSGLMTGLSGS